MKRITTVLRESEAMAVRKAVCVAGGELVVITPIPQRLCALDPWQCHGEQSVSQKDAHVQLEVMADDSHYGGIVSAINKISNIGKIYLASLHAAQVRRLT